jgi:fructose-bisphosphate aldolase class II
MAIPTPEEYAAVLDAALAGGYALAAVNVTSSQTLNAALRGFDDAGADGIVQLTTGGAGYLAGGGGRAAGARALAALAREVAADLDVHVALHTDHCPPAQIREFLIPLLLDSRERHARGEPPLFNSHMFDGSTLPLEDNLKIAAGLLDECHTVGAVLEIDCGVAGDEDLLRVAEALGSGERGRYLMAATIGDVHGTYARAQGAYGVVKVNVGAEADYAFTRAVADHVLTRYEGVLRVDGGVGDKDAYDPRAWGLKGEAAMAARVAQACEELGSAGRSITQDDPGG